MEIGRPGDTARAAELSKTRTNVVAAIARAEEEWLAASEVQMV